MTAKLTKKFFVVKKLNRTGNWDSISLIDSNGNFRGEAKFTTKELAQEYLKLYKQRINERLNAASKAKTRGVKYQIFELDAKSILDQKKQKYRFAPDNTLSPIS
jgi:hypothetical protein